MTDEQFALLKERTQGNFLEINDASIIGLSASLPKKYQVYLDLLTSESRELKLLYNKKDHYYGTKLKDLKENYKKTIDSAKEYEAYIHADDAYYSILINISKQETIVKYLEETVNNIKSTSYNIKNFLELKKFYNGG